MGSIERLSDMRRMVLVADMGSIVRAAERTGCTRSALSRIVRRVELKIGEPLFERRPGGMALTSFGEILVGEMRWILREVDAAEACIRRTRACMRKRSGAPLDEESLESRPGLGG